MRIKEFLRNFNSKKNNDGNLTYDLLEELLCENEGRFKRITNINTNIRFAKSNFLTILNKTNKEDKIKLIVRFLSDDRLKSAIEENFVGILEDFNTDNDTKKYLKRFFCVYCISSEERKKFIEENIEEIIKSIDKFYLLDSAEILKRTSPQVKNVLNEAIKNNKLLIAKGIIKKALPIEIFLKGLANEADLNDYSETLSIIIDELLKSECLDWVDIKSIGKGGFSTVYKIGGKVLKVGEPKASYKIPNHERIVQPILRTNLIGINSQQPFCCLEISDYLKTVSSVREKLDSAELYKIYKELRDAGIKWTDIKWDNVGRLIRPNIPTLNGQEVYINPSSVGFDKVNDKTLSAGELAIIDIDFLYNYDEESENIYYGSDNFYEEFEKKYREERMWEDAANLTKKRMKNLILEYRNSKNDFAIGVIMSEFARMTDEEFEEFLDRNGMILDVERHLSQRISAISKNRMKVIKLKDKEEH